MSILVVCPSCRKRYTVSEKFAGQSGPCPNCKTVIRVPTKDEELQIHDPTRTAASVPGETRALPKPILRRETRLTPVVGVSIGTSAVGVLLMTWLLGRAGLFAEGPALPLIGFPWATVIGLLLVSPPLVVAGYFFLHDDESLEPYRGKALYVRAGVCSLLYVVLWGFYGYVVDLELIGELWTWLIVAPAFLAAGGVAGLACFDLEFGPGFFHYSFYLFVTILLRWLAGLGWVWEIPEKPPLF